MKRLYRVKGSGRRKPRAVVAESPLDAATAARAKPEHITELTPGDLMQIFNWGNRFRSRAAKLLDYLIRNELLPEEIALHETGDRFWHTRKTRTENLIEMLANQSYKSPERPARTIYVYLKPKQEIEK